MPIEYWIGITAALLAGITEIALILYCPHIFTPYRLSLILAGITVALAALALILLPWASDHDLPSPGGPPPTLMQIPTPQPTIKNDQRLKIILPPDASRQSLQQGPIELTGLADFTRGSVLVKIVNPRTGATLGETRASERTSGTWVADVTLSGIPASGLLVIASAFQGDDACKPAVSESSRNDFDVAGSPEGGKVSAEVMRRL